MLKKDGLALLEIRRIISIPEEMPSFAEAVRQVLIAPPLSEDPSSITLNSGELEISMEDMYVSVPKEQLQCIDEMKQGYAAIDQSTYFGLHIKEA
jgi:hypothetical protein